MLNPSGKLAYRINEAVQASGIGRSKLYELIRDNQLRTTKIGGVTVIPCDALRELLGVREAA